MTITSSSISLLLILMWYFSFSLNLQMCIDCLSVFSTALVFICIAYSEVFFQYEIGDWWCNCVKLVFICIHFDVWIVNFMTCFAQFLLLTFKRWIQKRIRIQSVLFVTNFCRSSAYTDSKKPRVKRSNSLFTIFQSQIELLHSLSNSDFFYLIKYTEGSGWCCGHNRVNGPATLHITRGDFIRRVHLSWWSNQRPYSSQLARVLCHFSANHLFF